MPPFPCTEYHVAKHGNNENPGTLDAPFLTIQHAANIAQPGDTVTVHEGTYREWVKPQQGGYNDQRRITYQAALDAGSPTGFESVIIKGSRELKEWTHLEGDVWTANVHNHAFGSFNPYSILLSGDWFITKGLRHTHGEVYIDGRSLYEADSLNEVKSPTPFDKALQPEDALYCWTSIQEDKHTVFYANFQGMNPNEHLIEINARPACFYPDRTGVNYITVRGFEMCQTATPWAPPTAEQMGTIGPHWSKGWIIEYNTIHDSRCSGISLGVDRSTGQNEWTELGNKHGSQREREVIFRALQQGWSRENIGSHIVRNNHIHHCEQTAIVGHLGAIFSEITDNHIHHIHVKRRYTGHEMSGIKLHAPIDTLLQGNYIHHCIRGLWMDWQAQGTRITRNLLHDNEWEDCYVEVSHGPYMIDHNIMLSEGSIKDCSQGGCYAHNLFSGTTKLTTIPNRFTPYHFPHSTAVLGVMTILGGDTRFYNNIFAPIIAPDTNEETEDSNHADETRNIKGGSIRGESHGTSVYDPFPMPEDDWCTPGSVDHYGQHRLPVTINHNIYYNGAKPYHREAHAHVVTDHAPETQIKYNQTQVIMSLKYDPEYLSHHTVFIDTDLLGSTHQTESPFESPEGKAMYFYDDYEGMPHMDPPLAGPFSKLYSPLQDGYCEYITWDSSVLKFTPTAESD